MSKQLTMWCVFNSKGIPTEETLAITREWSINLFDIWWFEWEDAEKRGYTCRKVRVTIEEVKP